jgi:hypothetical protein
MLVVGFLIGLGFAPGGGPAACAQSAVEATLEVVPDTIQFAGGASEMRALAILHNGTTETLAEARLATPRLGSVTVEPEKDGPRTVPPGTDVTWILKIGRTTGDSFPAKADVVVAYNRTQGNNPAVARFARATITLSRPEIEAGEAPVTLEVHPELEKLGSGEAGRFNLVFTNKTATDLKIAVKAVWPESLKGSCAGPFEVELPAHGVFVKPVAVLAGRKVRVGKQVAVFKADVKWGEQPYQNRSLSQSVEIPLDVPIASPILQLFGAPLLLLLPGFLVVQTWALLWRLGLLRTRYDAVEFPLDKGASNADFALIAVLISLVLNGVHWLFKWDYVVAYGFDDLVLLYLLSVAAYGLAPYVVVMLTRWTFVKSHIPAATDGPIAILRKLGKQGISPWPLAFDRGANAPKQVFVLERLNTNRVGTWIGPPIKLKWQGAPDAKRTDIEHKLDAQSHALGDASIVADLLQCAVDSRLATVDWQFSGGIRQPTEVKTEEVSDNRAPSSILTYV